MPCFKAMLCVVTCWLLDSFSIFIAILLFHCISFLSFYRTKFRHYTPFSSGCLIFCIHSIFFTFQYEQVISHLATLSAVKSNSSMYPSASSAKYYWLDWGSLESQHFPRMWLRYVKLFYETPLMYVWVASTTQLSSEVDSYSCRQCAKSSGDIKYLN